MVGFPYNTFWTVGLTSL